MLGNLPASCDSWTAHGVATSALFAGTSSSIRLNDSVAAVTFFDDGGERGDATWPAVQFLVGQKVRPTKAGSVCVKVEAPVLEWRLGLAAMR